MRHAACYAHACNQEPRSAPASLVAAAPGLAPSAHLRQWCLGERGPLWYRGNGPGREYDGGGIPLGPLGVRRICRSSWCRSGTSPSPLSRAPIGLAPSKFGETRCPSKA